MKKSLAARSIGAIAIVTALTASLAGCSASGSDGGSTDGLTLGFSQVGAESGWRTANTASVQESAKTAGIDLKFSDAQQKQENQIKAIRSFIQQNVDVIAFSPVVESGWDTVLKEAKAAGIPVVLTDRAVDSADETLYESFIGSDFVEEGEKAGDWVVDEFADADSVTIAELQGTTGSAPAVDRQEGFADVIGEDSKFEIVASQSGDFTRSGGKQVTEAILKSNPDIDLIFAHNDDMALGAIEALEAAGKKPGTDVKIVSIDAVKDGMTALSEGQINFIVECSPLLGDQLMETVEKVAAGEEVEKRIVTEETTFDQEQATAALPDRKY
ncbi:MULTISPECIES: ABC transporter substrate-binding protein [unclassified Frigoribacterium]|uniref:ABC transporter substrate-binding protein n=1 Tax=unclassified Frigoribacterium TaxID=2627005 RepID=UPI0006F5B4A3|nr:MULTISPECIES: ABC transporter substrate-binding protein [unclassified Frigoribacterium]KQO84493.1 LacI family transcriptional regulator [Frigoribacterium sp. Leaf263]KQR63815.1 LacI family transcriptional regulator [Frigoribacterium sp. Leaf172]